MHALVLVCALEAYWTKCVYAYYWLILIVMHSPMGTDVNDVIHVILA
jgi:hypothetical protein